MLQARLETRAIYVVTCLNGEVLHRRTCLFPLSDLSPWIQVWDSVADVRPGLPSFCSVGTTASQSLREGCGGED